jgi:hypothetical protein
MLDGIEMNVVRAALKVVVVADGVFAKASLPKQILATVRRYRTIGRAYPGFRFASSGLQE